MLKRTLLLLAATVLFIQGCSAPKANLAAFATMKRVALVNVTLDKVGTGPANDPLQQQMVDFSAEQYLAKLNTVANWQIVPPPAPAELSSAFADLASNPITAQVLNELADKNQLPGDIAGAMLGRMAMVAFKGDKAELERLKGELIGSTIKDLQNDLTQKNARVAQASALAGVPFYLSNNEGKDKALATIRRRVLADYCERHGLDGVVYVHQRSDVGTPGDIRVIVQNNRVLSSLKLNPMVVVMDRKGEVVYSSGWPRLDDLAPMKLAMPIYTGTFNARGVIGNFILDLDDPKGTSKAGYRELIEKTSAKQAEELRKALQP